MCAAASAGKRKVQRFAETPSAVWGPGGASEEEAEAEEEEEEEEAAKWAPRTRNGQDKRARLDLFPTSFSWPVFGLAWAQGASPGDTPPSSLRLAVGSFLEDRYTNKVAIADFDMEQKTFAVRAEFSHDYAATKLLWRPANLASRDSPDLLATSGDYLRLWWVSADGAQVQPHAVLCDPLETDWRRRGAVTSFDWAVHHPHFIVTTHANGTIYLWDINENAVLCTAQAHKTHAYDVAFNQYHGQLLATASGDGSIRLWDMRDHFDRTRVLFQAQEKGFFRVGWHPGNEHILMALPMSSNVPVIIDTRYPLNVAMKLQGHTGSVNALAWSPYPGNANQVMTGGDDCMVNMWEFPTQHSQQRTLEPKRHMRAQGAINNIAWNAQEPYAAINYDCTVLVFPL